MIPFGERLNLVTAAAADSRCRRSHVAIAHLLFCHFYNSEYGYAYPSMGTLAKAADTDRRNAQQTVHDLAAWGYLSIQIGAGTAGKFGATNAYTPGAPALGVRPSTGGDPQRQGATVAPGPTDPQRQGATKPLIETLRGIELPIDPLRKSHGGQPKGAAKKPQGRDPQLYLAKHGCTIDSYQPDPMRMTAWASINTPLIKNPAAPGLVEEIKDVWRKRGDKPKDFDATYRTYLRKRQEWAEERQTNGTGNDPLRSRAAI
jgi:hypothetical protein